MATTTTRRTATRRTAAPRRRKRKLSKAGVRLIAGFEGFRSDLYNDAAGHCTIGYGHLVHTGNCDGSESGEFRKGLTREHALEILGEDAESAAVAVNDAVKVPLEQDQFDALTSFVFNVGSGAFRESTLLKLLNEGKYDEVPAQLGFDLGRRELHQREPRHLQPELDAWRPRGRARRLHRRPLHRSQQLGHRLG